MITVVTKPFESAGEILRSGRVIDSTGFRNESKLIDQRYLRPATDAEQATVTVGAGTSRARTSTAHDEPAPTPKRRKKR